MRMNSKILMLGTALVAMSQASLAYGETATGASTNDDNAIVVTANKRVENANKVGLTMTVLSGTQLAERKITSLVVVDGEQRVEGVLHLHDLWGVELI